jgi:hypothetical protein
MGVIRERVSRVYGSSGTWGTRDRGHGTAKPAQGASGSAPLSARRHRRIRCCITARSPRAEYQQLACMTMVDYHPHQSAGHPAFSWKSALVGGMAAIGGSALLGTLVANTSLRLSLASGLTLEEAYARISSSFTSPVALLSLAVVLLSGFFGGYVSALYGSGRHLSQGLVAGVVASSFFGAMSLGPPDPRSPGWYVALHLGFTLLSSLVGSYIYARRAKPVDRA